MPNAEAQVDALMGQFHDYLSRKQLKSTRQRDKQEEHELRRKRGERRQSKLEQKRAAVRDSQPPSTRQTTEIDE